MLTYEYECLSCGRLFEAEQRMSDPCLTECPSCHGQVRRLVSAGAGFIVRGQGATEPRPSSHAEGCAFERTGTTCCGRSTRCSSPGCDPRTP